MNIKIITLALIGIITCTNNAHAIAINPGGGGGFVPIAPVDPFTTHTCKVESSCVTSGADLYTTTDVPSGENCASSSTVYLDDYCSNCGYDEKSVHSCKKITSCNSCPSGHTRTEQTYNPSGCQALFTGVTYYTCCAACTNCNDSAWTTVSGNTALEQQTIRTCECGTCKDSGTRYRCKAGYYGWASSSTSTCTACPKSRDLLDLYTGTSDVGSTMINNCYITSGSDITGSYTFTDRCYYTL